MGEKSNKLGVAMVHTLCPICTVKVDSDILMNTQLSEKNAKAVEAQHNMNKWSNEPCDKCADMKKLGFILIGAVETKTTDATNPYRSGNIYCVKWEVAETLFAPNPPPKSGVAFVDVNVLVQMELPNVNINA